MNTKTNISKYDLNIIGRLIEFLIYITNKKITFYIIPEWSINLFENKMKNNTSQNDFLNSCKQINIKISCIIFFTLTLSLIQIRKKNIY